jgi:ectoine hydroxylase-related dioxygenase (phytanoyl-CoA dioxygenase family)
VDELLIHAMLHRGDDRLREEPDGIVHWSEAVEPLLDAVRSAPRLLDIAAELLGTTDVGPYSQQLHCRRPGIAAAIRWRRDEVALACDIAAPRETSVAVALHLDDVLTVDHGAALFMPGSHERDADGAEAVERCEALLPRRGMIAVWNAGAIHGFAPNLSKRDRRFLLQNYARADAIAGAAGMDFAERRALG